MVAVLCDVSEKLIQLGLKVGSGTYATLSLEALRAIMLKEISQVIKLV
jgi:hypothetical protein